MQLRTSKTIESFHDRFRKKYNFEEYVSLDRPTLFLGVYSHNDRVAIEKHQGIKIVWFAGSDILTSKDTLFLRGAVIVAESKWIEEDLYNLGLKYISISLFMDDIYAWKPVPHGNSLYWYKAHTSKYGKRYYPVIRKAFPDMDIITNDNQTTPKEKMPEVYAKCFAGIRPVDHDGMSQTVAEMALMGRITIYNGDGPFSMPYLDENGLIEAIRTLRAGYNYKLISKRARGYFITNEAKWCEFVLRLCGTSELGVTGIFEEDKGRCASMFRIQRKSDIDKIGGLGSEQFERPWFSEQMSKLNKKELVTSKNSGFVASEWKAVNNKGYPKDLEYITHDKKYD